MNTAELIQAIGRGEDSRHQFKADFTSANGAPPSQPGATPQVKGRKQNEG